MLLDVIRSLYQYNAWANRRIHQTASGLTPEQLLAPAAFSSYPSLHATLVHTLSAEWIWLARWQGTSPRAMLAAADFPDLPSIQARGEGIAAETEGFIDRLTPARLAEVVAYVNTRGETWAYPLWQQMIHQVNHGTQHRSEVAALLTLDGCSPGDLDYLVYQDVIANLV